MADESSWGSSRAACDGGLNIPDRRPGQQLSADSRVRHRAGDLVTRSSERKCNRKVARQVPPILTELPGDQDACHAVSTTMMGLINADCPGGFSNVSIAAVAGM